MPNTQPVETSSIKIIQSETFRNGMTAMLGIATATIVACLVIFRSSNTAAAITNVGKLLIDTDAGADDAIAIIMALESERLNRDTVVVGITCVNGNTYVDNVALNVLKTLKVIDRLDIPVYKGAHQPLLAKNEENEYFGKDGFGDFQYPDSPSIDLIQEDHAVNAMIDLVKASPGEITLLAIGPLTNIALAIRMYSSFLDDLQQLIILGGTSEGVGNIRPGIEFNFGVDPAANYIVFNASTSKPAILIPAETMTRTQTTMAFRNLLRDIDNKKMWLINSAESISLNPEAKYWECADAVAATVALTSGEIVTKLSTFYSEAVYEGIITAGMIVIDYTNITKNTPNVNLIQDINAEEYHNMLLKYLS